MSTASRAETPGDRYFSPWEGTAITSWDNAQEALEQIINISGGRRLAWRGQADASWSLHSSLYRSLIKQGRDLPAEAELLRSEERILAHCRDSWRFNHMTSLEILAHLQHFGAPTRLIDVSYRPHVALWFAVSEQATQEVDARLFAFDTSTANAHQARQLELSSRFARYELPWKDDDRDNKWCYELPMTWTPPAYNERIPAQAAGFLLAGVPKARGDKRHMYRRGPRLPNSNLWRINEARAATSVPTHLAVRDRKPTATSRPTFTLRIKSFAKAEILERLENFYGFSEPTMYPDLYGMAQSVRALAAAL